jgi:hypothetical protein
MSSGTFLFCMTVGAAALAFWVIARFPGRAPASLGWAFAHVAAAMAVGSLLKPMLAAVAGAPLPFALFVAVFGVALPALMYMFLAGAWLLRLAAAHAGRGA